MKLNGNEYTIPEINFKTMCALEDYGVDISSLLDKPLRTILAFATLAIGDEDKAAHEIETHIANGGNFEDMGQEIRAAIENSGFFKSAAPQTTPPKTKKTAPKASKPPETE